MKNKDKQNMRKIYNRIQTVTKIKHPERLDINDDKIVLLWCPLLYSFPGYIFKKSNTKLNPNAIELLKKHKNKINWSLLSLNPNAIELLSKYKYEINWMFLSENPNAIELLENNNHKDIDWYRLSSNPNAIKILKKNIDKIDWDGLSKNPNAINFFQKISKKLIVNK